MYDREDFAPAGAVRRQARVDFARVAQAHRAKPVRVAVAPKVGLWPSPHGGACPRCGVNNTHFDCAHFAKAVPVERLEIDLQRETRYQLGRLKSEGR